MPWEKRYDETEVLERAMEAFWARGYEATSIGDLVTATGVNRGSLYAAFASKRGLFLRALSHYDRRHRADFLARIARAHAPRAAILAAFSEVITAAAGGENRKGCLLVNTAIELSPHDPEIARFVAASLAEVEGFFRTMIEAGQAEGSIPGDRDPAATAQALLGLFLGLRVLSRSRPEKALMGTLLKQAEALVS